MSHQGSHIESQWISQGDSQQVGNADGLWKGQGTSQWSGIAGCITHDAQKGTSQGISMASMKVLLGHNASHWRIATNCCKNSSASTHPHCNDNGVDEDEDKQCLVTVLFHLSQSYCISCTYYSIVKAIGKEKEKPKMWEMAIEHPVHLTITKC